MRNTTIQQVLVGVAAVVLENHCANRGPSSGFLCGARAWVQVRGEWISSCPQGEDGKWHHAFPRPAAAAVNGIVRIESAEGGAVEALTFQGCQWAIEIDGPLVD